MRRVESEFAALIEGEVAIKIDKRRQKGGVKDKDGFGVGSLEN